MFKCQNCSKEYEKQTQLSGHLIHCNKKVRKLPEKPIEKVIEKVVEEPEYIYNKWMELPPPVIDWLKINFGGWLNHIEVGRTEYRSDFGGYGIYIKVPEEYSTEWKKEQRDIYDNRTRAVAVDEKGNPKRYDYVTKDVRYISLQLEMPKVLQMLERVKNHIIESAHRAGIRLPSIGDPINSTTDLEDYKKSLYA